MDPQTGRAGLLTLERSDQHIPILDELLDEFICPLQLDFMAFESLSEVRTVQERVAELQSGESHCNSTAEVVFKNLTRDRKLFASHPGAPV